MAQKRFQPPMDLTERGITNSIKSSQIDLTDDIRRHAVVGIALNNCLVPQLKEYVDQQMKSYYKGLVKKYKIDSSESSLDDSYSLKAVSANSQILSLIFIISLL